MPETPREYKKRIEEKWKKNEKNKEKLIKEIEGYKILDERFKTKTKKEILANFEKNQNTELESDKYTTIVAELGKIDEKYEELENLKGQLETKKVEKIQVEIEIKRTKLDGADETTLNLQMANVKKLNEILEKLQSEIEELEEEIKNREQEKKVIEELYGKKTESENIPEENGGSNNETEYSKEQDLGEPETLKQIHEQTIKDLWNKDKTRKDIIKILDSGIGIDDELKKRVKTEVSERFFKYYDERQGDLKVKSARYIKNKLKSKNGEYKKMKGTSESAEKKQKLNEIEALEVINGKWHLGKAELSDKIGIKIKQIEIIRKIGGKPVYKAKDEDGKYHIMRGKEVYLGGYDKILEVEDIGGEPVVQVDNKKERWLLIGEKKYKILRKLKQVGGKQVMLTEKEGKLYIIRGKEEQYSDYFTDIRDDGIIEIGGKLVICIKNNSYRRVYRGYQLCGYFYKSISVLKEIGGKPCFIASESGYKRDNDLIRGDEKLEDDISIINEPIDIGGKPVYKCNNAWIKRGDRLCGNVYDEIKGEIKNADGKPSFIGIKDGVEHEVLGYNEI